MFEEAGTTRDSRRPRGLAGRGADRFVDTAGMRRAIRVKGVEYYSFVRRARRSIEPMRLRSIFDANEGSRRGSEDRVPRPGGRPLLLVANKWDLVEGKDRLFKQLTQEATLLARATVIRTSAVRGQGVTRIPELLLELRTRWAGRATTSRVNQVLQELQGAQPRPDPPAPPLRGAGREPPPSFVFFGGGRPRFRLPPVRGEQVARGLPPGRHTDPDAIPATDARRLNPARRRRRGVVTPHGYTATYGPWRSLVSASDWGSEGRRFESGRPDG